MLSHVSEAVVEIQQLRHMQAAARHSSYARAATECFTSRQNIAHSVKSLEAELGVSLFERKGNGVMLTPAGKIVARRVDGIVAAVDNLRSMFSDIEGASRSLSLGVSNNLFAGLPHGADELFDAEGDRWRFVEMDCERCYRSVLSGKVDAAIVSCMKRDFQSCSSYEVMTAQAYIITDMSSPLAAKGGVSVSDLRNQRLLLMSEPAFQYEPLFAQLDVLGYDRDGIDVIASTSSMVRMVRKQGGGVCGIVSGKFADRPPAGTAVIQISDAQLAWHYYILYRLSAESSNMVMKLADSVRAALELDSIDNYDMGY